MKKLNKADRTIIVNGLRAVADRIEKTGSITSIPAAASSAKFRKAWIKLITALVE